MVGEAGCVPGPCLRLRFRRGNRSTRSAAGQRQSRLKAAPALPQTVRSEPLSLQSKRGRRLVPSRSRNGDTPVGRTLYRRSSLESRGFCQRQATPRGLGVPRAADPARRTVRAPDSGGPRPQAGGETGRDAAGAPCQTGASPGHPPWCPAGRPTQRGPAASGSTGGCSDPRSSKRHSANPSRSLLVVVVAVVVAVRECALVLLPEARVFVFVFVFAVVVTPELDRLLLSLSHDLLLL